MLKELKWPFFFFNFIHFFRFLFSCLIKLKKKRMILKKIVIILNFIPLIQNLKPPLQIKQC